MHSPEPWRFQDDRQSEYAYAVWSEDEIVADIVQHKNGNAEANARRITAAVNFCQHLPTELIERLTADYP